jgi:dTMP kinase
VLGTREPSTGPVGVLLRELLAGRHAGVDGSPVDGRTMALLFAADRRDHLKREIEPALASGIDVVSDRYLLSSLAYQAEEADQAWVQGLSVGVRVPDLTLLLDLPIAVAAERRARAERSVERYDADETLERVADNYRRLAARGGAGSPFGAVGVVDGSGTLADVARAVTAEIEGLLARLALAP